VLVFRAVPRYCQRCVLPETRPGVKLDDEGVCLGCRNVADKRSVDWSARAAAFEQVVADAKAKQRKYDCVIPVSGGKDGYWQTLTCLEAGLHPLCITYRVPLRNELGQANLDNLARLGVDHIDYRPNPHVERAFIERAFRERGISHLVAHMAIFALPLQVALAYDAPLVVYGENSAVEYGTEDQSLTGARVDRRWLERFGVTEGTTAEDWVDDERLTADGMTPYYLPPEAELAARDMKVVFLGHFFEWDPDNSRRIAEAHGFRFREDPLVGHVAYTNIDDDLLGIHHHPKWHKFGITRTFDTLSLEIRNGRMSRPEAIGIIRERGEEVPWTAIEKFCDYVGFDQAEYFRILERFRNPAIWSRRDGRWVIDDFIVPDFEWPEDPAPR
jgi:N-acetyl sugar amidotransferase